MADERPKCGRTKRDGTPCGTYADMCRNHGPDAAKPRVLSAKKGGPGSGNPHPPAVKEAAAERLARGEGVVAVANALNLPHQTIVTWKTDPAFMADVGRLRAAMIDAVSGRMAADAEELWERLMSATRGESKTPQGRLALDALKAIPTWREVTELEERIAALEAAQARQETDGGDDKWV